MSEQGSVGGEFLGGVANDLRQPSRAERERPLVEQRIREDVNHALKLMFSDTTPGIGAATLTYDFDKLNDAARALNSAAWRASTL